VNQLLAVIGLALASFVSTSLDNFALMLGFFADDEYPKRQVAGGYVLSVILVLLLAWMASAAVEMVPSAYLGYLGVVPLGLGLVGLYRLLRHAGPAAVAQPQRGKGFFPVLLIMLANSGDSFSVYVSVFADTAERLELPILTVVVTCAFLAAAAARWLVTRSGLGLPIQRIARLVLPFLLIAIGAYILFDTGTDTL
jgi:cadmium resistance protein CadD (predicted permease)